MTTLRAHHPEVSGGLFELAVLNANDAILVAQMPLERGGGPIITFVNPGFTALTLYRPDEVLGKSVRILHGPRTDQAIIDRTWNALTRGESARFETINYRKDGSEFWNDVSITPIADASGRYTQLISIRRDTTERHKLEDSLRAREASFRQLFEHNPIAMWVYDRDTRRFLEVNQAAVDQYGYTRERFLAMTVDEIRPPVERQRFRETLDPDYPAERRFGRWRHLRCDGSQIIVEIIAHRTHFRGSNVALVAALDVTEQERARAELEASEERFRAVTNNVPGIVYRRLRKRNGEVSYPFISAGVIAIFGVEFAEVTADAGVLLRMVHPADSAGLIESYGVSAENLAVWTHDFRIVARDGQIKWLRGKGTPRPVGDGDLLWDAIILDITEQKRGEQALHASELRLRSSEEHLARAQRIARIGSWQCDAQGALTWSPESYRIFGLPVGCGPLHRDIIRPMIHAEDREVAVQSVDAIFAGDSTLDPGLEYRIVRPDGAVRVVHREGETITDAAGRVIGVIGTVQDVTEVRQAEAARRELEAQLLQSQKMEALGRLAGGMAHDLNNILVPILSLSKLAMKHLPLDGRDHANIAAVYRAGTRARDLVQRVLAFSRKQPRRMESVDLVAITRDTLAILRATLPASITMRDDLVAVPPLPGDASQLAQLIMNLVTNAAHAIGDRPGVIELVLHHDGGTAGAAALPHVRLKVRDTGCGMEAAVLARIFEPFFTTKPVNEGTGLGLSIVHGIVASHGGRIDVASTPGEGTTVDIRLPLPAHSAAQPGLELAT